MSRVCGACRNHVEDDPRNPPYEYAGTCQRQGKRTSNCRTACKEFRRKGAKP